MLTNRCKNGTRKLYQTIQHILLNRSNYHLMTTLKIEFFKDNEDCLCNSWREILSVDQSPLFARIRILSLTEKNTSEDCLKHCQ